jgi:hypothetical protein
VTARLFVAILFAATLVGGLPASLASAQNCVFVLGFATLHNMIPQIVGNCLENETHNPANGDGLQATTGVNGAGGLLVWRKADNFTAFTDGFRTWVNGPFGLQMRLNSQRFFWESNPQNLPIVPPPTAGAQCHTAGLSLQVGPTDAGAGNFVTTFTFTNTQAVPCTMFGFVGGSRLDAQNNPVQTRVVRNGGPFSNQPGPSTVTVPSHGTATFMLHWEDVPVGNETTCPTATQLAVTPPNEFDPIIMPYQTMACNGGELDVTAVRSPG